MTIRRVETLPPIPIRPAESHKGTYGRVMIVGGRAGMAGAAALAGLGALRGGAGLVYLAVPRSVVSIVSSIEPSYLTLPLNVDITGELIGSALDQVQQELIGKDSLGIGPGIGTSDVVRSLVTTLYQEASVPMVIDADALNCLAEQTDSLSVHAGPRILTPHPGEFARLTRSDTRTIQANREQLAIQFAAEHDVILVLKGHRTIVTDGERIYVNTTGNAGMATGGTGDVLTGLTTALLAQKMLPFEAAQLAVYLHGLAGDLAAQDLSEQGLIASDLPKYLAKAWQKFRNESSLIK
ncbi:NAD(P)H-hydrate dehydratase [Planctomicrobium sp. SH527]|uniref:NAD(P)H-hydrate dehydratase n=1 Tax=Planctomicrobium sp. SH527 TaxID=3448123 RepID=UPI003F5C0C32